MKRSIRSIKLSGLRLIAGRGDEIGTIETTRNARRSPSGNEHTASHRGTTDAHRMPARTLSHVLGRARRLAVSQGGCIAMRRGEIGDVGGVFATQHRRSTLLRRSESCPARHRARPLRHAHFPCVARDALAADPHLARVRNSIVPAWRQFNSCPDHLSMLRLHLHCTPSRGLMPRIRIQEFVMQRAFPIVATVTAVVLSAAAASAFAEGGSIGHAGSYGDLSATATQPATTVTAATAAVAAPAQPAAHARRGACAAGTGAARWLAGPAAQDRVVPAGRGARAAAYPGRRQPRRAGRQSLSV
ncbi:MAG: hypothetical protein GAK40_00352 [Burkholderia plantarii]|nr:MAG: hypothetical protein GAK40_00352 [Burkholderia plantarii]